MQTTSPERDSGGNARLGAVAAFVGFLFAMEVASGMLQGWFTPIVALIGEKYAVGSADLNWVSTSFLLSTAVLVPLISRMGDRYGHKRMLTITAGVVAIGSLVVAFAPSYGVFLAGRVICGALVAFLPLEFAIVRERAGEQSGKAIGLLVGGLTAGVSAGAVLSGLLAAHMSLTALLLFPAVCMAIAFVVVLVLVPETSARTQASVDWVGAALVGAGLALALYGISIGNTAGWTSGRVLGCIIGGLVLLAVWVAVEQRIEHPLIELSALQGRGGIGLPILIAAVFGAQLFGGQTPLALFASTPKELGFGLGLSASSTGLLIFVVGFCAFLGTVAGPRLAERLGEVPAIVIGAVVAAAGSFLMVVSHGSLGIFLPWLILNGFGNGIIIAALPNMVVRRAPADSVGIASGLYNTSRTVAGAIAGAAFTAVMSGFVMNAGAGVQITGEGGYEVVWVCCGVLSVLVALLSLLVRSPKTQKSADESTTAPLVAEV
ncbi:MFS transporter [Nocardioides insulae]|uniref:MFS transporter n=1 Tax=Nocardioides insulae TaxID=394734 RepID=UPI000425EDCC|nr:MFS transporter [Nocardioides insulae]